MSRYEAAAVPLASATRASSGVLLALLTFNFGAVFLDRNALSYLIPFVGPELRLSNADIGLLSSGTALMWALSGFALTTLAARRTSSRKLLIWLGGFSAATTLMTGVAASFLGLLVVRLAAGVFAGPVMPISQALIATTAGRRHRGLQMGVMQSVGSSLIASILGPAALVVVAAAAGWRRAVFCNAVVGFVAVYLLARHAHIPQTAQPGAAEKPTAPPAGAGAIRGLLAVHNVRRCAVVSIAMVGWLVTGITFYPLYLMRVLHASAALMGLLMTVTGVGGLLGAILLPHVSDRLGRRPIVVGGALLGLIGPLVLLQHPDSVMTTGIALASSALAGGTFPLFMATLPSESLPAAQASAGIGFIQGVGECLGGVAMPYAAGVIADFYGLEAVLLVIAGCALAAALAAAGLAETAARPGPQC